VVADGADTLLLSRSSVLLKHKWDRGHWITLRLEREQGCEIKD